MSHSERGKRKLELLVQLILERSFQVTFYIIVKCILFVFVIRMVVVRL